MVHGRDSDGGSEDSGEAPLRACYMLGSGVEEDRGGDGFRGLLFMQEPESRQGCLHVGIRVRRLDDVIDGLDAGPYEVYAAGWNDRSCEDMIEWGGGLHGAEYAPAVGATGYVRIIDQPPDQALGAATMRADVDVTLHFPSDGASRLQAQERLRFRGGPRVRNMCTASLRPND